MTRVFIKPAVEHAVPKPDGAPLAAEGEMLKPSAWWRRREQDGDVTITARKPRVKPAVKAPVKTPDKPTEKEG